jgi:chorismate synthase
MANIFGHRLKLITWGESHGAAIGAVIDGYPSGILIDIEKDIQQYLNLRRPGSNQFVSPRNEPDKIEILSGVFNNITTGAPISLIIYNKDYKTEDYVKNSNIFRPGHFEWTYSNKYKHFDFRGGGRGSARETALRVAAGALARKIIPDIKFESQIIDIAGIKSNYLNQEGELDSIFRTRDLDAVDKWKKIINEVLEDGDSVGGKIRIEAFNMPIGLGEPIYDKLSSDIAKAMFTIPAVKSFSIGSGEEASSMRGSVYNDQMFCDEGGVYFSSNNNGGICAGISTGQNLIITISIKPTSSIKKKQISIDSNNNSVELQIEGRHDPCIALRSWIVLESQLAFVLADHFLLNNYYRK